MSASDTPRTEKHVIDFVPSVDPNYDGPCEWVPAGVSRQLERELAAVTAERDALKRSKTENDERFMIERDQARAERDILLNPKPRTASGIVKETNETLSSFKSEMNRYHYELSDRIAKGLKSSFLCNQQSPIESEVAP